jgi:hypothetical protein
MSTWPPLPPAPAAKSGKGWGIRIAIAVGLFGVVAGALAWKTGTGAYHNYQIAFGAVDRFHHQMNLGDYDQIYDEATDEFRRSGTRQDLKSLFEKIHDKMGSAGEPRAAGFHVNWRNGVVWVDQTFNTPFLHGQAQESFVWKIEQGKPFLYHYRINSPDLD